MRIAEGLGIIQQGWIRKPGGFRVTFDKWTETGMEQVYSPPLDDAPLNSDVTAWRYAWKLWRATIDKPDNDRIGALYNIRVVDDRGQPIRFFVTNEKMVYNSKRIDGTIDPCKEL